MHARKDNKLRGSAGGGSQVRGKLDLLIRYQDNISPGTMVGGEEIKYPGAYKIGQKVLALMSDMRSWKVAEIYSVRPAKLFDETVLNEDYDEEDDVDLLDEISVLQHPKTQTNEENKMTYLQKYIQEFKEAQKKEDDKDKTNVEKGKEKENEKDKDGKNQEEEVEEAEIDQNIDGELQKQMRYEYYVHFMGIDRRSDRWSTEQLIKIDDREITE